MDQRAETEQSFLKLYDEFAGPIFRHCYFRVSSREVAEDLTQDSFMRIWNYIAKGQIVDNQKAFLYKITGNLIIDYYRKKKEASLDVLSEAGFDPAGEDENATLNYAECQHVIGAVKKLESPYREAISMRYIDGFSLGDIAEVVGETENVVSVRIHRGIEKLKKLYKHENSN